MKPVKLAILAALAVIFAGAEKADVETPEGVSVTSGEVTQGTLQLLTEDGKTLELPLEHTDVDAHVSGYIARVDVTQRFGNPYEDPIEAVYVFPLPDNAAVDAMTMHIGDKVIKGVIKKREEAREIYEQAVEEGKTASLLEQERPNIFTQTVGNIMPGDDIRIEISYVQDLAYDHGTYEYTFPMVVGPRFIPGEQSGKKTGGGWSEDTEEVPDASRITPPVIKPEYRSGHDISLKLTVDAGMPIQDFTCPSHDIAQKTISESSVEVAIKKGDRIPNKDFIFRYDVAGTKPEYALLTHARGAGDGYFMLMIQPQAEMKIAQVTPKEMIFVVDCSGSMSGFPLEKAKEAMRLALENMNPDDYFNVIKFSDAANGFAPHPVPNTPENVKKGLAFVDAMHGSGGTRMIEGIKAALGQRNPERKLHRFVLFMTDGYIGNEAQILAAIQDRLQGHTRLFSFGVGSSVNRYLLDRMARVGRGQVTYCRQDEDPGEKVELFYERIAKPYLMDIEIDWNGLQVTEVYPERIPDLFSAQPVIIHGRYTKRGSAVIKVKGNVRGKPVVQEIPVVFPEVEEANDVIATLWARTKISYLSGQMYRGEDEETVEEITDIALRYRIMSSYTSFVAVSEEVRNVDGELVRVDVPIPMPEGVSYEGVFGEEDGAGYGYGKGMRKSVPSGGIAAMTCREAPVQPTPIAPPSPEVTFEKPTVLGSLTADEISSVFDEAKDELTEIYEKYLEKSSALKGRVVVGIILKPDGTVEDVTVKLSTLEHSKLEKTLVKKIEKLNFPAPPDKGKVIITVGITFKT